MDEAIGLRQKAVWNSFWNTITTLFNKIGGLVFSVVIARLLLPELFGVYMLTLTIVLVSIGLADSGINTTLARFVSDSLKKGGSAARRRARARFSYLFKIKMIISLVIAASLFLISDILATYVFSEPLLSIPIKIGALYILVISIEGMLSSILFAVQKIKYQAYIEFMSQLIRVALVVILLGIYVSVEMVFASLIVTGIATTAIIYAIVSRNYHYILFEKVKPLPSKEKKRIVSFLGWSSITLISLTLYAQMDFFMLGIFLPSEFVGYYTVIFSLVTSAGAIIGFTGVLLPTLTQVRKERLEGAFQEVIRYVLIIGLPAAVGLAFVAIPAIKVIYGIDYVPAEYELPITLAAIFLSTLIFESLLSNTYTVLFQSRERPKVLAKIILYSAFFNILLNVVFISQSISFGLGYGLVGAASATFISRYGKLAGMIYSTRKNLGIRSVQSSRFVFMPLLATFVMAIFLYFATQVLEISLEWLLLTIPLAVLVYFGSLWLLGGIEKKDLDLIKNSFNLKRGTDRN